MTRNQQEELETPNWA